MVGYKGRLVFGLLVLTLFGKCLAQGPAEVYSLAMPITGTWGDQGDGTYRNPVLSSNYPDSDVERWEDKWYMISSKGRYMKGMTILESEDLVNWSILGGIVDSVDWYDADDVGGEGVWAGDLLRHNDQWFCYFIDIDKGLFVCMSDDITGPWSKPRLILERKGMTDPTVYFDPEIREGYLVCNYEIVGTGDNRVYHNRLFRLSWNGLELLDEGRDIYVETGAEAAKLYKINSYYYLFFSEWTLDDQGRKADRRQVVLRSQQIDGPYEKRVLLERDPITGRSSSQGALTQAPDGSWWYLHQLVQQPNTFEGRPQCLIPVTWEADWPILGDDPDGNGIGNTVWSGIKPVQGKPIRAPQTDESFNTSTLAPQWLWDGNPINHLWSLDESPGCLRLYGVDPTSANQPFKSLPNKLLQRKMGREKDTITTKMGVAGVGNGQSAGLVVTGHNLAVLGIEQTEANGRNVYVEFSDGIKWHRPWNTSKQWVYLRAILDGRKLKFSYSWDGSDFVEIGKEYLLETKGFNGLFIGLFSKNNHHGANGYADFDWLSYCYDGPKDAQLIHTE